MTANAAGTEMVDHTELSDEPTDKWSEIRAARRPARDRLPDLPRRPQDQPGARTSTAARPWPKIHHRARQRRLRQGVRQPDVGPLLRPGVRPAGRRLRLAQPAASHPELLDKLGQEFKEAATTSRPDPLDHEQRGLQPDQRGDQGEREGRDALHAHEPEADDPRAALRLPDRRDRRPQGRRRRRTPSGVATCGCGQFLFAFANDEGEESLSFQGTIPQALMMMNGELMEKAVGGKPGSFLADLLEHGASSRPRARPSPTSSTTSTSPRSAGPRTPERARRRPAFLSNYEDTICVMEDMFWALLNSNEFVLNR